MGKDIYIVWFPSMERAQYWRVEFVNRFAKDVVGINRSISKVELNDSIWYFKSELQRDTCQGLKGHEYTEEDMYIILDDKERMLLDSYEGDRRGDTDDGFVQSRRYS